MRKKFNVDYVVRSTSAKINILVFPLALRTLDTYMSDVENTDAI